ncbi:MAG: hypothetical protein HY840_01925 [Bacteroidetes bacterium]|nr:hypothetical protein [Bacteroidota bacterium]
MKNILLSLSFIALAFPAFSQTLSSDTLHWSSNRKLEWKDFSGKSLGVPGMTGQETMVMNAKFYKTLRAKATVETVFDRKKSWAPKEEQTEQELKYYRTMFDLYEVESRKLRKLFKETKFGLDPDKVFQEKYNEALEALDERSKLYMEETGLGADAAAMEKWNATLQLELKELEAYQ